MTEPPLPPEDDLTPQERDMALAGEYVLGLLPPEEMRAAEARRARDPAFRAMCTIWAEDLVRLTDDIAPETPPPAVAARIRARLFPGREGRGVLARLGARFGLWQALGGALAAALIVVGAQQSGLVPALMPDAERLAATLQAEGSDLVVQAAFDPASGALVIERPQGDAPEGRVLELWLILPQTPPLSLGLLPGDPAASALVLPEDLLALLPGATLAVSEEPPGGSPTGAPTGSVLAVGTLAPA